MGQMLLINPGKRRRASKAAPKRRAATRRAPARRRPNPLPVAAVTTVRRALRRRVSNPKKRASRRRRQNPISIGRVGNALSVKNLVALARDSAIGGVGAVGMDVLWGKLNPMLPLTMQTSASAIGVGDAVKAAATAALGLLLSKPTKGLSKIAAQGALTTQFRDMLSTMLPDSMPVAGVGRIGNMGGRPMALARANQIGRIGMSLPQTINLQPSSVGRRQVSPAVREGFRYP